MTNNNLQFRADRVSSLKRTEISAVPAAQILLRNTMRGIIMKKCSGCKEIKSVSKFQKNRTTKDGLQSRCKQCRKQERHSEKHKAYEKHYWESARGKAARKLSKIRYLNKYPKKKKAQTAISHAIRDGLIPKVCTLKCSCCPAQAQEYHHHKGYAKKYWLDVVPVCAKHHRQIHYKANFMEA